MQQPGDPGAPDGEQEHLFVPLHDEHPELVARLRRRYAELWLAQSGLPSDRLDEAMETTELKVAPEEHLPLRRLRLRSFYTGTTYWLYEWDGSEEAAFEFIESTAELQAGNVRDDRRYGPTPWDESPNRRRKRERRAKRSSENRTGD